ncbi:hypothetical protein DFH07DRAFT_772618 [Mycena maculata]|uniref:Transmembrane protein n=1 Tax=Mycena maculata TaxID=230809 RepID=A0AAD7J6I2_9AGAR|nr:hypothetical protein DFH07DRAFT_772618 [Mycena maculata]
MFFLNIRRLTLILASGSVYMAAVDSPLSPASLSVSSLADNNKKALDPIDSPTVFETPGYDIHASHAIHAIEPPATIETTSYPIHDAVVVLDRPQIMSPFGIDWSDFDLDKLDVFFPAWLAVARTIRTDPTMLGEVILTEGVKTVLYLGGLEHQKGIGLGEEVDRLDRMLTSVVLRLAINLVFGMLAALVSSWRKWRVSKLPVVSFAQELDVWALGQLHSTLLAWLVYTRVHPAALHIATSGSLIIFVIMLLCRILARALPPSPPPPRKKKKCYYQPT